MTDKREAILVQLNAILDALAATTPNGMAMRGMFRNRGDLPQERRPAFVLLDGDEIARPDVTSQRGSLRIDPSPTLVDMTPEIWVVMNDRDPGDLTAGSDMNMLRVEIAKAVLFDATLMTLLGANGRIRYIGVVTDMASGRAMMGEMNMRFTLTYVFRPSEL